MSDKPTRGKANKIDFLPEDIQKSLIQGLRDKTISQSDLLDSINDMIDASGLPDDMHLSRSGLNRYATKMEAVGARIRQAREVSKQWTAELGDKPTTEVGKILREIIRTLGFEVGSAMMEGDVSKLCPKSLNQLALLSVRLEDAEGKSLKREQELRKAFAIEAADQAATVATAAGMTAEGVAAIKREILGIA